MRTTFPIAAFYFLASEKAVSHFNVNYSSLLSGRSVACKCASQVRRGYLFGSSNRKESLDTYLGLKSS